MNLKAYASLLKLSWIKEEALSLIATITTIFIIETFQDITLFGLKEFSDELLELMLVIIAFIVTISILGYGEYDK